jgi:hypothetical protein
MQREAGEETILARLKPCEPDSGHACQSHLLRDDLDGSATYFRARSSTAGSDLGNKPSRVKVPHECHRFFVTNRAPHRGQMLVAGSPSSAPAYPIRPHLLAIRPRALHVPMPSFHGP